MAKTGLDQAVRLHVLEPGTSSDWYKRLPSRHLRWAAHRDVRFNG